MWCPYLVKLGFSSVMLQHNIQAGYVSGVQLWTRPTRILSDTIMMSLQPRNHAEHLGKQACTFARYSRRHLSNKVYHATVCRFNGKHQLPCGVTAAAPIAVLWRDLRL
jgi:hypothetical protein